MIIVAMDVEFIATVTIFFAHTGSMSDVQLAAATRQPHYDASTFTIPLKSQEELSLRYVEYHPIGIECRVPRILAFERHQSMKDGLKV